MRSTYLATRNKAFGVYGKVVPRFVCRRGPAGITPNLSLIRESLTIAHPAAQKGGTVHNYPRESRESPILEAFCRVAPSDRFKRRAIDPAGTFFRASDLSSRTCTGVQARRFFPFSIDISVYER